MAEFAQAITITLQHEGGFTHEANGDPVNMGLTETFLRGIGYIAANESAESAETAIRGMSVTTAMQIYQRWFWEKYLCGEISSQEVASKVFDIIVNMGPKAILVVQRAANTIGAGLKEDGIMGPATIRGINACDSPSLMAAIRFEGAEEYEKVAIENPLLAKNLTNWIARLNS